jgi:hypothetical protein
MTQLQGPPGELRITLEIKRAATGTTETVEIIGHAVPDEDPPTLKEADNGCDSYDRRA